MTMKLLLDQNISKRIVYPLNACYPNTSQVFLLGLELATAKVIWDYAKTHDYIIVTKDSDFHEFSLIYGPPPKILWLKCGNQTNQYIQELLLSMSDTINEFAADKSAAFLEIY